MPKRIQLSRRKGWKKPTGCILVSRPSKWGNPFPVAQYGARRAVAIFRAGINKQWARMRKLMLPVKLDDLGIFNLQCYFLNIIIRLPKLRGHPLGCWCKPYDFCHADILLEAANRPEGE